MIEISFTADSLAKTRFEISPLMQAGVLLYPGHPAAPEPRERRLYLLDAMRRDVGTYAPDFLTPALGPKPAGFPDIDAALHQVASTPAHVVARQLRRLIDSRGGEDGSAVCRYLELGEREFAQRIAGEMEAFWKLGIGPRWASIVARAEDDIERRAAVIVRHGLSAVLGALHPGIAYRDGVLTLERVPAVAGTPAVGPLTLFPSPVATGWLVNVDPWGERGPYLVYPVRRPGRAPASPPPPPPALANVIGHSRLALLADLGAAARTTTELAELHCLSASTVSYHLGQLHRSGLVSRARSGKRVYYRRTAKANLLLERPFKERKFA
ncbi:ArsR/SmtB family transcription factor [Streptomyces sp. NPDC053079]|uniref:ArsR/SmtB family transcription factor n=1 Tax=Streptomyces sp. NPDC053079 TaxID=3365697 RepID=UPI0037D957D7